MRWTKGNNMQPLMATIIFNDGTIWYNAAILLYGGGAMVGDTTAYVVRDGQTVWVAPDPATPGQFNEAPPLPDWAYPVNQQQEQEEYEFNSRYDRWEGWGDPDPTYEPGYNESMEANSQASRATQRNGGPDNCSL